MPRAGISCTIKAWTYSTSEGLAQMRSVWRLSLLLAAVGLALTACSNDNRPGAAATEGQPAASASAEGASGTPTASAEADAEADGQGKAEYAFDLKAEGFEKAPEGTTLEPVDASSVIYVPADRPNASVRLDFDLVQKGDFTIAEGTGSLDIDGKSVPFSIDQISVMHQAQLKDGHTFVYGGLQVNAKSDPSTFAFGFRFIPETKELELRLSNGEGLVVFGRGDTFASDAAEIESFEAAGRPKN